MGKVKNVVAGVTAGALIVGGSIFGVDYSNKIVQNNKLKETNAIYSKAYGEQILNIEKLKEEIKDKEKSLALETQLKNSLIDERALLIQVRDNLQSRYDNLTLQKEQLEDELAVKLIELNNQSSDNELLGAEIQRLQDKIFSLGSTIKELEEKLRIKVNDIATLQGSIDSKDEQIMSLNSEISELNSQYTIIENENESLKQQIEEKNNNILNLQNQINSLQLRVEELQNQGASSEEIENLHAMIETLNNDISGCLIEIDNLNRQIEELQNQGASSEEIENLQNQIADLTSQIDTLKYDVYCYENYFIPEFQNQIADLNRQIEELQNQGANDFNCKVTSNSNYRFKFTVTDPYYYNSTTVYYNNDDAIPFNISSAPEYKFECLELVNTYDAVYNGQAISGIWDISIIQPTYTIYKIGIYEVDESTFNAYAQSIMLGMEMSSYCYHFDEATNILIKSIGNYEEESFGYDLTAVNYADEFSNDFFQSGSALFLSSSEFMDQYDNHFTLFKLDTNVYLVIILYNNKIYSCQFETMDGCARITDMNDNYRNYTGYEIGYTFERTSIS